MMASRIELFLNGYFRVLALSCSAQKGAAQQLLSGCLALVLGDMLLQLWHLFHNTWELNELQQQRRKQFLAYTRIIDALSMAYLLSHISMVAQALLLRKQERKLLGQLPALEAPASSLIKVRIHASIECIIVVCGLGMTLYQFVNGSQLLPSLREFYTMQAVRARYLQMALLVVRLDVQLLALQQQLVHGRRSHLELRASYAHIVRLARKLSRLYGLSVLIMNVLCIGDFIVVCYAYMLLWNQSNANLNLLLVWQTVYMVLPTIIKIWTLCAVCDNCTKRSQELLVVLNGSRRRTSVTSTVLVRRSIPLTPRQVEEFSMQIMQNRVQFEVCGIYQLNIQNVTGMVVFIFDTLVIFMQFLGLTMQQTG